MVTNLPQEAKMKWNEVAFTKNPETRLQLMEEFLRLVPKHKGTDKLCNQIKRQMAQIRDDLEKKKKLAKKSGGPSYYVQKAGAAQIAVIGPANAGRSSLLRAVTNSQVQVTSWPFGTTWPTPAMLSYQDIQFQLVEIPPIIKGSSQGKAEGFMNLASARNADSIIIMVDLTDDPTGNYLMVARELENSRILTAPPSGQVEIQRRGHGRDLQFIWEGELIGCSTDDVTKLLNEFRIRSALVRIKGQVSLEIVEDSIFGNAVYRPTIIIANKSDKGGDPGTIEQLKRAASPRKVHALSCEKTPDLTQFIGQKLFDLLNITRIYTKEPGKGKATIPIVSQGELTVGELAKTIHNDFYDRFKFARIWGPSARFDNEKVGIDRGLKDGTVIQLYVTG